MYLPPDNQLGDDSIPQSPSWTAPWLKPWDSWKSEFLFALYIVVELIPIDLTMIWKFQNICQGCWSIPPPIAQGCMPGNEPIERLQAPLDVLGLHVAAGLSVFVYNDPSTEDQQIQYTKYQNSFEKRQIMTYLTHLRNWYETFFLGRSHKTISSCNLIPVNLWTTPDTNYPLKMALNYLWLCTMGLIFHLFPATWIKAHVLYTIPYYYTYSYHLLYQLTSPSLWVKTTRHIT